MKKQNNESDVIMKLITAIVAFALLLIIALAMTGCTSTIVMEFDKDGKLLKKTITDQPISTIEKSLKNKAVVAWGDGLSMSGSISPGTTENPMPHVKGEFRNGNGGLGTFPKDMNPESIRAIAAVVAATKTDAVMGIDKDGVSIGGKKEQAE